jgi:hypothetical protein
VAGVLGTAESADAAAPADTSMHTPASESAVRAEPERDEVSSPADLSAAIEKFSELDWLRVKKAALHFYGRCGGDWEVLQNEALVRALDGRRNQATPLPSMHRLAGDVV